MHKLVIIDDSKCKEALNEFLEENQENVLVDIPMEEFNQRIENIIGNLTSIYKMHRKIICRNEKGICRIPLSEIIYIQTESKNCVVRNDKGKTELIEESLDKLEKGLKEMGFFRLNTDMMINMDFMECYIPGEDSCVILTDSSQIRVDKDREADLFKYLNNWK